MCVYIIYTTRETINIRHKASSACVYMCMQTTVSVYTYTHNIAHAKQRAIIHPTHKASSVRATHSAHVYMSCTQNTVRTCKTQRVCLHTCTTLRTQNSERVYIRHKASSVRATQRACVYTCMQTTNDTAGVYIHTRTLRTPNSELVYIRHKASSVCIHTTYTHNTARTPNSERVYMDDAKQ